MSAQYHVGVLQMSNLSSDIWKTKMFIVPLMEWSAILPSAFLPTIWTCELPNTTSAKFIDLLNFTIMNLWQEAVFFACFTLIIDADVAPSFAEMDEAIQSSIQESLSDMLSADEEELQLSPAHQLVLNCIWLNLKVRYMFSNLTFIVSWS